MSSIIERLTEGMVNRDMHAEGHALLNKWEKTGLLEGLDSSRTRSTMARLLENQAKELLRESSSMAGGDVEGFAAVAFPIVRRVFAGLIANDLVSVQPMSLPSGLIFFLDFTVATPISSADDNNDMTRLGYVSASSLYGGGRVGSDIISGAILKDQGSVFADQAPYNLANGYSSPTGSAAGNGVTLTPQKVSWSAWGHATGSAVDKLARYDADFVSGSTVVAVVSVLLSGLDQVDRDNIGPQSFTVSSSVGDGFLINGEDEVVARQIRRLTRASGSDGTRLLAFFTGPGTDGNVVHTGHTSGDKQAGHLATAVALALTGAKAQVSWQQTDDIVQAETLGAVIGQAEWGLEGEANIPEIDIKVDSSAITARTKKLKAKWTPELGQDLNAYHNLDAEVELTSILSEQIALEIDREILADLINGAKAATYYWSRSPGLFVNRDTGAEIGASSAAPDFTGTVSEWYETLVETINDVSAQIHRKTLRGGANFIVCGPEVANILEFTAGFRASVTHDDEKGSIGAVKVGSLTKKFDVIVDPYFLRNVILVGRRGSSFLESGYVYAPYVPLQTTPTIFGPEDFVPRKGVMTRYGKKMVRPDMYGLVVVRGLLGEAGATS